MGAVVEKINCWQHKDDTASCALYDDGKYYCFGCGAGGVTPINKAVPYTSWAITPKPVENIVTSIERIESLPLVSRRGLSFHEEASGYYVVWPDKSYYKKRLFNDSKARYKSPLGHTAPLFITGTRNAPTLLIVEGEINAMSVNIVAPELHIVSPGGASQFATGALTTLLKDVSPATHIAIVTDNDSAGATAAIQAATLCRLLNLRDVQINLAKNDANDILYDIGPEALKKQVSEWMGGL